MAKINTAQNQASQAKPAATSSYQSDEALYQGATPRTHKGIPTINKGLSGIGMSIGLKGGRSGDMASAIKEVIKRSTGYDQFNIKLHDFIMNTGELILPVVCALAEYDPADGSDKIIVALPIALAESRMTPLGTRNVSTGRETIQVNRYASEVHDQIQINAIKSAVSVSFNTSKGNVTVLQTKIVSDSMVDTEKDRMDLATVALKTVVTDLTVNRLGIMSDVSIASILADQTTLTINVGPLANGQTAVDESGVPIACSTVATISSSVLGAAKMNNQSLHSSDGATTISTCYLRATATYSQTNGNPSNIYGGVSTNAHCFSPRIIIEDVEVSESPTMNQYMLVMALMAGLADSTIIKGMLVPESLGVLNLRANITSEKTPSAISPTEAIENYDALYAALFNDNINISVVVKPGTFAYNYASKWLACANTGKNSVDARNYMAAILTNLLGVEGTELETMFHRDPIINPVVEKIFTGTYVMGGETRPLSEIDLIYLMNKAPGDIALHQQWALSESAQVSVEEGANIKLEIIKYLTGGNYNIIDQSYMITFTPSLIIKARELIVNSGIPVSIQLGSSNLTNNTQWAPSAIAGMGYIDQRSMQQQSPYTNQQYNFVYQ